MDRIKVSGGWRFVYLKNIGYFCSKHSQTGLFLPARRHLPLFCDEINVAVVENVLASSEGRTTRERTIPLLSTHRMIPPRVSLLSLLGNPAFHEYHNPDKTLETGHWRLSNLLRILQETAEPDFRPPFWDPRSYDLIFLQNFWWPCHLLWKVELEVRSSVPHLNPRQCDPHTRSLGPGMCTCRFLYSPGGRCSDHEDIVKTAKAWSGTGL